MIKDILDNNRQKLQKWQNYRLDDRNIVSYIRDAYNIENVSSSAARLISNFQPVVKKDSGLTSDCTLLSISAIIDYYTKYTKSSQDIYDIVESVAEDFFYNRCFTIPDFIKIVIDRTLKEINIIGESHWYFYKKTDLMYNDIKTLIQKNKPIILSLVSDGREYYKDHSVIVIGYIEYNIGINKKVRLLKVYDNCYDSISYIDYEKMDKVCCINYL